PRRREPRHANASQGKRTRTRWSVAASAVPTAERNEEARASLRRERRQRVFTVRPRMRVDGDERQGRQGRARVAHPAGASATGRGAAWLLPEVVGAVL